MKLIPNGGFFTWFGFTVIALALLLAAFAYLVAPDNSPSANTQVLEIRTQKPGFRCSFLKLRTELPVEQHSLFQRFISGKPDTFRLVPFSSFRFSGDSLFLVPYGRNSRKSIEIAFHIIPLIYSVADGEKITAMNDNYTFVQPNGTKISLNREVLKTEILEKCIETRHFILGTDMFGRDLLSRIIIGLRVSLAVGFISVLISLLLGVSLGSIAGYFGGFTDKFISWIINVVWSIPTLLLVIAISLALGKGFWQVFVAVGLSMWVEVARMVRGQVMSLKEKEFIEATRALGYSHFRILWRHIIPNVMNPVIVISAANFASAILMEAGLSFLGLGVQPPVPSLGSMIKDHYGFIIVDKAYLALIPGLLLMVLVLAFTLGGDGIREWLDVRKRHET